MASTDIPITSGTPVALTFNVIVPAAIVGNPNPLSVSGQAIVAAVMGTITLSISGVTANGQLGTLPANGFLGPMLLLRETAGHAVSVSIGTTLGGSDVLTAQPVPPSGTFTVAIGAFSKGWFSATATQALYLTSASWGGASINATLYYAVGP